MNEWLTALDERLLERIQPFADIMSRRRLAGHVWLGVHLVELGLVVRLAATIQVVIWAGAGERLIKAIPGLAICVSAACYRYAILKHAERVQADIERGRATVRSGPSAPWVRLLFVFLSLLLAEVAVSSPEPTSVGNSALFFFWALSMYFAAARPLPPSALLKVQGAIPAG